MRTGQRIFLVGDKGLALGQLLTAKESVCTNATVQTACSEMEGRSVSNESGGKLGICGEGFRAPRVGGQAYSENLGLDFLARFHLMTR